ncbi:MAG: type II secretion system minor pseudopilin GspI [Pseudomonadota bacterium]|nr:type II secretion system minor pseudopilin GspI [Pseudomonadota bacterium]
MRKILSSTSKSHNQGFTLIEVLVALAIVAIALGKNISITRQDIMRVDSMQKRMFANWIAQNKLAENRLNNIKNSVGTKDGSIIYAGSEWTWEIVTSKSGIENLLRMDVSVSNANDDVSIRKLTGFVYTEANTND